MFAHAGYAWLLAVALPCLLCIQVWAWRKNRRAVDEYMPPSQRIHERPTKVAQAVLVAICDAALVAFCILGLMHPERKTTVFVPVFRNAATVVIEDISPSMKAEAGYFGEGGRLGAVKEAFRELLGAEKSASDSFLAALKGSIASNRVMEGQRVGIVAFAGEAFTVMPPTPRQSTLLAALRQLSTETPVVPGTNFSAAIEEALSLFKDEDKVRVAVLLTDGEEEEGKSVPIDAVVEKAIKANVRVYTVVVGHERALIPGTDIWTEPPLLRNVGGNAIGVKPESVPAVLAKRTGGECFMFSERGKLFGALSRVFNDVRESAKEPVEKQQNLQPWCAALWLLMAVARFIVQYAMEGERPSVARPA